MFFCSRRNPIVKLTYSSSSKQPPIYFLCLLVLGMTSFDSIYSETSSSASSVSIASSFWGTISLLTDTCLLESMLTGQQQYPLPSPEIQYDPHLHSNKCLKNIPIINSHSLITQKEIQYNTTPKFHKLIFQWRAGGRGGNGEESKQHYTNIHPAMDDTYMPSISHDYYGNFPYKNSSSGSGHVKHQDLSTKVACYSLAQNSSSVRTHEYRSYNTEFNKNHNVEQDSITRKDYRPQKHSIPVASTISNQGENIREEEGDMIHRYSIFSNHHPIHLASSTIGDNDDDNHNIYNANKFINDELPQKQQNQDSSSSSTHSYMPNMYHDFSIQPLDPTIPKLRSMLVNQDPSMDDYDNDEFDPMNHQPWIHKHHSFFNQEDDNDDEIEFGGYADNDDDDNVYIPNQIDSTFTEDDEKYPVIYRYFGRSKTRSLRYESPPYIILCPNVDHFKVIGEKLSSRGFNTMICQRVIRDSTTMEKDTAVSSNSRKNPWNLFSRKRKTTPNSSHSYKPTDGTKLVLAILDVLKWKKAVIIGCGTEALLAIEAALHLAPSRVAGLILCGDLTFAHEHASEFLQQIPPFSSSSSSSSAITPFQDRDRNLYGPWSIDKLLHDYIFCPCTIVWDGDWSALISSKIREDKDNILDSPMKPFVEQLESKRCVIIGGGSAPYRKLPEQFSWACTRFVEKELTKNTVSSDAVNGQVENDNDLHSDDEYDYEEEEHEQATENVESSLSPDSPSSFWAHVIPDELSQAIKNVFNPGSLVVSGRLVASVIIYFTLARVTVFHYKNAAHGLAGLKTSCLSLSSWWRHIASFFLGFIPVLSKDVVPSNTVGNDDSSENKNCDIDKDDSDDKEQSQRSPGDSTPEDDNAVRKLFFYDQIFT